MPAEVCLVASPFMASLIWEHVPVTVQGVSLAELINMATAAPPIAVPALRAKAFLNPDHVTGLSALLISCRHGRQHHPMMSQDQHTQA